MDDDIHRHGSKTWSTTDYVGRESIFQKLFNDIHKDRDKRGYDFESRRAVLRKLFRDLKRREQRYLENLEHDRPIDKLADCLGYEETQEFVRKVYWIISIGTALTALIFTMIGLAMQIRIESIKFTSEVVDGKISAEVVVKQENFGNEFNKVLTDVAYLRKQLVKLNKEVQDDTPAHDLLKKMKGLEKNLADINSNVQGLLPEADSCETVLGVGVKTLTSGEDAYCSKGWTVFQRNKVGDSDFSKTWDEFKNGFGGVKDDFWIGLEKIHRLTRSKPCKLRIEVWDKVESKRYAEYNKFYIDGESDNYKVHVSEYSGTAGDGLIDEESPESQQNEMSFTTADKDNDKAGDKNCADASSGAGWWYNSCFVSNLNLPHGRLVWDGSPMKSSQMMLRCE